MSKSPIKILFVSAEVAPFAKVGGLADVAGALPHALKKAKTDIKIMMPLYGNIERITDGKGALTNIKSQGKKYKVKEAIKNFEVFFNGKNEKINVYEINFDGVILYFIDNEKFSKCKEVYKNENKFLFFSKAIADLLTAAIRADSFSHSCSFAFCPDIIHCNDNHTAIIPLLLKIRESEIKTVLTIHNLEFQGQFSPQELKTLLGISTAAAKTLFNDSKDGDINKMAQGVLLADAITTVSPTYAEEILTPESGVGLDNLLMARKDRIYGIINGIDIKKFNPAADNFIKYHYSSKNLKGKGKNKETLLKEYFIRGEKSPTPLYERGKLINSNPLIALISRLTSQKGIDLVIDAMPKLFKEHPDALFILLGTGDPSYEIKLKKLSLKYPNNFKAIIGFDLKIAQKIYAGADIFLMPSKFEPCGLGQLTAMRYGTVPIVRKTGGLADTIIQLKVQSSKFNIGNANGFMFEEYSSSAMMSAIDEALKIYPDKKAWEKLVLNGMKRDSSWDKSATEYLSLYKKILNDKF